MKLNTPVSLALILLLGILSTFAHAGSARIAYSPEQRSVLEAVDRVLFQRDFDPAEDASADEVDQTPETSFEKVFNIDLSPLSALDMNNEDGDFIQVSNHRHNAMSAGGREGRYIDVNLSRDVLTFHTDGGSVSSPMSHGRAGHPTPTGDYSVVAKDPDAHSAKYHNASMPNALFFIGTKYGIHGGNIGGKSHGCIRLPYSFAAWLYPRVPYGTPVSIHY